MRTKQQIEADQIDMEMHRLSERLAAFSREYRAWPADEASLKVFQSRHLIRQYMHEKDREETNG